MIKVSIIIPVYNTEQYLKTCLDSVLAQTLPEMEVICVDDGSTDGSCAILEEYAEKDSRIQIYHQKNQFAGVARNTGIAHAQGKYIVFWDSDDYFHKDALLLQYNKLEETNADICVCGGRRYFEATDKEASSRNYLIRKRTPGEIFNRQTNEDFILNFTNIAVWNKMFRTSFVKEQGLSFLPISHGEDAYFLMDALCKASQIVTLPRDLVVYRVRESGSLVNNVTEKTDTVINAWIETGKKLTADGVMPTKSFTNKTTEAMLNLLRNIKDYDAFDRTLQRLKIVGEKDFGWIDDKNYYIDKGLYSIVQHIKSDTTYDFLIFFSNFNYVSMQKQSAEKEIEITKNRKLQKKIDKNTSEFKELKRNSLNQEKLLQDKIVQLEQQLVDSQTESNRLEKEKEAVISENENLKNSSSYKIGRAFTALPRKISGKDL